MDDSGFHSFFYNSVNSTKRESLLLNRLSYDLKLIQAINGCYLKIYRSDVDDNGYDLILDTESISRKVQVKSKMIDSKTNSWSIAKGLLRQELVQKNMNPVWSNLDPGVSGGIILQEVTLLDKDIGLSYYYTDLAILTLYSDGTIGKNINSKSALRVIAGLHQGHYHEKIEIPKSTFLKLKSVSALAEVLGITSNYLNSNLYYWINCRRKDKVTYSGFGSRENVDKKIRQEIDKICC